MGDMGCNDICVASREVCSCSCPYMYSAYEESCPPPSPSRVQTCTLKISLINPRSLEYMTRGMNSTMPNSFLKPELREQLEDNEETRERFNAYCELLEEGFSPRQITNADYHPDMGAPPMRQTTFLRLINFNDWYTNRFMRMEQVTLARSQMEMTEIADDSTNDWVEREDKNGKIKKSLNKEHIARSQLRINVRRWFLERRSQQFAPHLTMRGDPKAPMTNVEMTREEYLELARKARDEI